MRCWRRLGCSRCLWQSESLRGHLLKRRQDRRTPHGVAVEWRLVVVLREALGRFGMLLDVGLFVRNTIYRRLSLGVFWLVVCVGGLRAASQAAQQRSASQPGSQNPGSSTGTPGTARVYVMNDMASGADATGLIPWDRAQAPFVSLSRKLGDQVQGLLAQRFKGSPAVVQTASVRQLRTTAAPAIAVEISSVTVEDRAQLDHMAPGIADAIARGAAAFRPA